MDETVCGNVVSCHAILTCPVELLEGATAGSSNIFTVIICFTTRL